MAMKDEQNRKAERRGVQQGRTEGGRNSKDNGVKRRSQRTENKEIRGRLLTWNEE
jgi:hypothetical protein